MSDKIKSLEIKKLIQEYNFLLMDDEYKKEVISEAKNEFLIKVQELKKQLGIVDEPVIQPENENDEEVKLPERPKLDPSTISKSTKDKVKKLYREIVKKTHPDKTDIKELNDLYIKATIAAEEYNLFELFIVCNRLNIDVEIDMDDKNSLTTLIIMKKKEINDIESSFIWVYANSATDEDKNKIIELFVNKHGTKT